ncbi:SpaH/EbpB family LPXTG-anchored major pilin [Gardnerella vaginalis]|uniref:SpaH/EbpB family LPXTG-anchored major pilin n=1 Tax=Gardnerella vaginalis TaxID=2702 RepID=UPI0039F084F9
MNKITKQCVAAVASLAMAGTLCVAGAVVAGSSAWAAATACDATKAPWATDQTANCVGSITITKYEHALDDQGHELKKTKVHGATFTLTKVTSINNETINLTKYDDWQKVAAIVDKVNNGKESEAKFGFGTAKEKVTGDGQNNTVEGVAKFDNLEIGLYKVEETKAADNYAILSKPFFMTVPEITRDKTSTDNTYKYDVTVDPKNKSTKDAISKTVDQSGMVGAGDEAPYTIKTDVTTNNQLDPSKYEISDFKDFAVWDDALISAYDGMDSISNANAKDFVSSVNIGNTPITNSKGQEDKYKVEVADSDVDKEGSTVKRKRIKVTFTEGENGGLKTIVDTLKTAKKSALPKLSITFKFKIKADAPTGGFYNKYGYQPGHGEGGTVPPAVIPPKPDENTKVTLVKFQIKKVDGTDTTKPLKDAKFAVFAKKDDADACAADKTRSADNCQNKATKGYTTGTTVADGLAGAQNGTADGTGLTGAFEVKVGQTFYVVETAAPEGFALSPKVEEVTAQNSGTDYDTQSSTFIYKFKDLPNGGEGNQRWFNLPDTGAAGVIIFALIGLGLVGSGMFVFLKNRKKEEEQAA